MVKLPLKGNQIQASELGLNSKTAGLIDLTRAVMIEVKKSSNHVLIKQPTMNKNGHQVVQVVKVDKG